MRTLVISDIHGCLAQFRQLLDQVGYNPTEDRLILLGDYCDRGEDSRGVIEEVKRLTEQAGVIALRGNHEQMMLDALLSAEDERWTRNGGAQTLSSYTPDDPLGEEWTPEAYAEKKRVVAEDYAEHLEFLSKLPLYYEDEKHIYVHAGLNPSVEDWKQQTQRDFLWIRDEFHQHPTKRDKTVVFGHTPTKKFHDHTGIWFGEDKIGIDGGCCFGHQLNCLEIGEDGEYTQHVVERNPVE